MQLITEYYSELSLEAHSKCHGHINKKFLLQSSLILYKIDSKYPLAKTSYSRSKYLIISL